MNENTIQMIPEMVTINTASKRTGLSYDWIRKKCKRGEIVHIKAGTRYLVNFGKLIDYLNTGDQNGGEESEEFGNIE